MVFEAVSRLQAWRAWGNAACSLATTAQEDSMANGTGYGGRGGSPVWIVIFVITTLVFMGTTYFCFKLYQDQRDAVSRLQDDIKTYIEDPIRQKGINAPTQDPVCRSNPKTPVRSAYPRNCKASSVILSS